LGQVRAAFTGQIADVPVLELIRTITAAAQSAVVHFETTFGSATLWFGAARRVHGHDVRSGPVRWLTRAIVGFEASFRANHI
jgi:hypothetical protein